MINKKILIIIIVILCSIIMVGATIRAIDLPTLLSPRGDDYVLGIDVLTPTSWESKKIVIDSLKQYLNSGGIVTPHIEVDTLGAGVSNIDTLVVIDESFSIQNKIDPTKSFKINTGLVGSGQQREIIVPDYNTTIGGSSSNDIPTNSSTATLTNKTIDGVSNTVSNIRIEDIYGVDPTITVDNINYLKNAQSDIYGLRDGIAGAGSNSITINHTNDGDTLSITSGFVNCNVPGFDISVTLPLSPGTGTSLIIHLDDSGYGAGSVTVKPYHGEKILCSHDSYTDITDSLMLCIDYDYALLISTEKSWTVTGGNGYIANLAIGDGIPVVFVDNFWGLRKPEWVAGSSAGTESFADGTVSYQTATGLGAGFSFDFGGNANFGYDLSNTLICEFAYKLDHTSGSDIRLGLESAAGNDFLLLSIDDSGTVFAKQKKGSDPTIYSTTIGASDTTWHRVIIYQNNSSAFDDVVFIYDGKRVARFTDNNVSQGLDPIICIKTVDGTAKKLSLDYFKVYQD